MANSPQWQAYIRDIKGWNSVSGNTQPGTWFDMVSKEPFMHRITLEGGSSALTT